MKETNKPDTFLKLSDEVLRLTHIPSRVSQVDGAPEMVEFTATDKILYSVMKKRFDHFAETKKPNSVGSSYYDTYSDVATRCGVSTKTVGRFVKKWKDHGYIDYVKYAGNKANYTMFEPIPLDGTPTILVAKGVAEIPNEEDYFSSRGYVDPEDATEWRSYDHEVVGVIEKSNNVNSFDDCPF